MDASKLVAQWLIFITGLSGAAALMPIFNFSIAAPTSLCMSSHCSLPEIRSLFVEYLRYIWGLLTRQQDHSLQDSLITPRNLFLLVNLIIFFLFASLHLQQHAAAGNRQKRRIQLTEDSINNHQVALQSLQRSSLIGIAGHGVAASAATMTHRGAFMENFDHHSTVKSEIEGRKEESFDEKLASVPPATGGRGSMESSISEAAPTEEILSRRPAELLASMVADYTESTSDLPSSGLLLIRQGSWTVDRDGIDGSNVEKIVLEEDGRLRLIEESPRSSKTCNLQLTSHSDDREHTNGSDCEKIVLEEDGQLRLIEESPPSSYKACNLQTSVNSDDREATNGSDCGKIVLEEDGRLRLIDRPLPASPCKPKPVKSQSGDGLYNHDGDNNNDISHSLNNSYINLRDNYDISDKKRSLNINYINLSDSYNISDNNDTLNNNYSTEVNYDIISDNNQSLTNNYINVSDNYDISDNTNEISHNKDAFNNSYTNISLLNNGDNSINSHNLIKQNDLNSNLISEEAHSKSSSVLRNVSESLETTWTAINDNREIVNATNAGSSSSSSSRPDGHKRRAIISRQNSRGAQFKPSRGSGGKVMQRARPPVRREPSLGQEELNSKVESFIARFNEQIRIQRQQSLLSYMQMVDRGA